ncbi:MlaD family protein [Paracoccus sanguinis]|uniref:MlaD family protein n=1 Tax=Paracoccus sanguinis TaxID=1545044 RepID=UPI0014516518|nr:MlaD family protein [Paracoccus sanguinis]QJD17253.1 MCE family protein [Paracoccus sanguinis]
METKANYLLIGSFTIAGFLGLLAFLMWFMGRDGQNAFDDYVVVFPEIGGISAGTQVQFSGVPVGQVTDIRLDPDGRVRVQLRLRADTPIRTDSEAVMVPQGITGLSTVSVSAGTGTAPLLEEPEEGLPQIRAGRSTLDSITEAAPELVDELRNSAAQLSRLLSDENLAHADAVLRNVDQASGKLDQAIGDISEAVSGIAGVGATLKDFSTQFDGLGARIDGALASVDSAASGVGKAAEAVAATDFAALSTEAKGVLADARALIGSDAAAALPGKLGGTLDQASAMLTELREGGTAGRLNEALTGVSTAAAQVTEAARGLDGKIDGALTGIESAAGEVGSAAKSVAAVDFAALSAEAQGILADLRAMIGSDDAAALPRNLSDTLAAASAVLKDLHEGGTAQRLNQSLTAVSEAAARVGRAADGIAPLSARLQQLAARTDQVVSSFGGNGALQAEFTRALREVARAAASVGSTARAIERNPQSIIRGR